MIAGLLLSFRLFPTRPTFQGPPRRYAKHKVRVEIRPVLASPFPYHVVGIEHLNITINLSRPHTVRAFRSSTLTPRSLFIATAPHGALYALSVPHNICQGKAGKGMKSRHYIWKRECHFVLQRLSPLIKLEQPSTRGPHFALDH